MSLEEEKRLSKIKDAIIAAEKWKNVKLKKANTLLQKKVNNGLATIAKLKENLRIAKLPKNSSNSSRAPSTDLYKPKRSKDLSLREKSGKKTGGQPGHKGTTLAFSTETPDEVINHIPDFCSECGRSLASIPAELGEVHQQVDIKVPPPVLINHQSMIKHCTCGKCNKGAFPKGVQGRVNYGSGLIALVVNLSVRQYVSYERVVEFIEDLYKIHISEGTVANILKRFAIGCDGKIEEIKDGLQASKVVCADETSGKLDGKKIWFHVYQNDRLTFIGAHRSRGQIAQQTFFPLGFPYSVLVHDCLSMQLSTPACLHQICNVHLLRELKAFLEAHPKIEWSKQLIRLIKDAIDLNKKDPKPTEVAKIEDRLTKLLKQNMGKAPGKIPAMWKRLNKHKDKIFLFLKYPELKIPPENNSSERAIRNVKVKVKVSGQFKSDDGAKDYATIRSIIDTANKQGINIHEELVSIAQA
ncbi:IS66 family transposase [Arachidicoccus ginsenosidivorans]|uniref:IS66 family transposase n=1 Tax=Arachidicoccus ginsenosidivorans TaxID=496057 RepID=UPI0013159E70|nr:IS66 family transposase [Arachidicoccus ginsenosidivorans]